MKYAFFHVSLFSIMAAGLLSIPTQASAFTKRDCVARCAKPGWLGSVESKQKIKTPSCAASVAACQACCRKNTSLPD